MNIIIRTFQKIKDKCIVLGFCKGLYAWIIEFIAKHIKSQYLQEKKHTIIINYLRNECWDENRMESILESVVPQCTTCVGNKTIWVLWYQGYEGMPAIVKECYTQLIGMKGDNNVVLLTHDNLKDYIIFPQYIYEKVKTGSITLTHYSDIIRFALLYLYGGFWVDATVWLEAPPSNCITESRYWTIRNSQPYYTISVSRYQWASFILYVKNAKDDFAKYALAMMLFFWEKNKAMIDYLLVDYCEDFASKQPSVKDDWEAIKQSNTKQYELIRNINNEYSTDQWVEWRKDTFAFKLSYKVRTEQNINSYYNKIVLKNARKI